MTIKLRPGGKSRDYPKSLPVLDGFFQSSSMVNTCLLRKTKIHMHVSGPRASPPVHKDWLTAWKVLFISQIYKPLAQTMELGFSSLQHLNCVIYLEMFSWRFASCLPREWNEGESVFLQKCWELEEIIWVQEWKNLPFGRWCDRYECHKVALLASLTKHSNAQRSRLNAA